MSTDINRPDTVRKFGSAACNITVKRWAENKEKGYPETYFIELSVDTGRKTTDGKAIWNQIPLQLGDVSGVVSELQRAGAFAQQKEDAVHA